MSSDRIRLAEAMGWTHVEGHRLYMPPGQVWGDGLSVVVEKIPDPFTDANDDYAVLKWVRESQRTENNVHWGKFKKALKSQFRGIWMYEIGDYARAALKVLDDKEVEGE